ncbi:MAG: TVP38/TMEM64 family protein, partial [Halanaerobium sp.]
MAKKKNKKKLIITIIIIAAAAYAVHHFGLAKYFSRQNLDLLQNWINDFGIMAPIIYIGLWIAACVFFLPGLPVAILGGLVFDPIPAVIYASLGSTTGATAAFLIGRYAARDLVEGWKKNN